MLTSCCKNCSEGKSCQGKIIDDDNYSEYEVVRRKVNKANQISRLQNEISRPRNDNTRPDFYLSSGDVANAIMRPDLNRGVSFPSMFNTPGTPIHKYNTLTLQTNKNGVCWAQVNFGQYLGNTVYTATTSTNNTTTLTNSTTNFGRSNVFVSNPDSDVPTTIDGMTSYTSGTTDISQFLASPVLREEVEMYNAIRAGPAAVWYDFTGRVDISSGVVTCGINYTYTTDSHDSSAPNGLLPDMNFVTLKAIEDCPYKLQTSVVSSVRASFIPHDQNCLDLKNPKFGETGIVQRFFILITGAAANEKIGQLKIATNFDGKPNSKYADNISTSITKTSSGESLKDATDWIISNGKVIEQTKDPGYGIQRFDSKF